jgi:ESS family glutamate:Na+ symporter
LPREGPANKLSAVLKPSDWLINFNPIREKGKTMTEIVFNANQTLVIAIFAFFVGRWMTKKIGFLDRYRIPEAVTGGLVVAIVVTVLHQWGSVVISFTTGEFAMLAFFTTIGLNARLSDLKSGGLTLVLTLVVCVTAVVVENLVGLGYAILLNAPPAAGIMAGSVALVGGHGTAAAWAPLFEESARAAGTIGLASATFGLVAGGVFGGPLGRFLILQNKLQPDFAAEADMGLTLSSQEEETGSIGVSQFLASILVISVAIGIGDQLNSALSILGLNFPKFVTALFAGILLGNFGPSILRKVDWPTHSPAMRLIADLSLSIFLVRALMSLKLWMLAEVAGPLIIVLMTQVVVVLSLAYFVLFRILKKTYDAAIISSGFVGLCLGATPTAVANMDSLSNKFGPPPSAFLVIPLVGAFFIDLINAFVISALFSLLGG